MSDADFAALYGPGTRAPSWTGARDERRVAGLPTPKPRKFPLPEDVVECPTCGQQYGPGGCKVDCGDDDSVSVDDVVGILAGTERALSRLISYETQPNGTTRRVVTYGTEAERFRAALQEIATTDLKRCSAGYLQGIARKELGMNDAKG